MRDFVRRWLAAYFRPECLIDENRTFHGTGGVSQVNGRHGFLPAFHDTKTGAVYLSRFADGRPAPVHLYEGLPTAVVADRDASDRTMTLKSGVVAGFVHKQRFYTRGEAARALAMHIDTCSAGDTR